MIWWTGLAPWEVESPFPGSLTSTFPQVLICLDVWLVPFILAIVCALFLLLSSLELSDTKVYEP